MIHKQKKNGEILWLYSMGKRFAVTAIATTVDEANAFMERNPNEALVACFGPFNIIAHKYEAVRPEVE